MRDSIEIQKVKGKQVGKMIKQVIPPSSRWAKFQDENENIPSEIIQRKKICLYFETKTLFHRARLDKKSVKR